jgi:putative phosphonate metabolism protein
MRLYSGAMATYPRYAIYYAAAQGSALERFGSSLIGYDAYGGEDLPFPDSVTQTIPDWRELTQDPRKYGFHATLKAPMALAPGRTEAQLVAACELFSDAARPVPLIKPVVDTISGFTAVIPIEPSAELQQLAADCTRAFDFFRAQLTPEDRARRNPARLTPRQCEYLDRWGYPYVMEEFRFHMTLTGRLPAERRDGVVAMLRNHFAAIGLIALEIDRIALFRQDDGASRFRIIGYWPLRASG